MSHATRRIATALVALGVGAAGAVSATGGTAAAPSTQAAAGDAPRTHLVLEVPGCEGCTFTLRQAYDHGKKPPKVWSSHTKEVVDGSVDFTFRTAHTHGMSIEMTAPWEQHTGFVTNVVVRYGGTKVGDAERFRQARHESRGSACWAGSAETEVTLGITAREVRVKGVGGEGHSTVAFVDASQPWLSPMREVRKGVLGSQDVNFCR